MFSQDFMFLISKDRVADYKIKRNLWYTFEYFCRLYKFIVEIWETVD